MFFKKISPLVCCKLNLLIATRIIGFIGLIMSVCLTTILLNDRYNTESFYNLSRKTALALGLDWRHLHSDTCTSHDADPEGKMISIVVIVYSSAYLLTNALLLFGSIKTDWRFAIPWLVCELLGCFSKFGALVYHWIVDPNKLSHLFTAGSMLYIVIMIWWWIVVFTSQMCWRLKDKHLDSLNLFELSLVDLNYKVNGTRRNTDDKRVMVSGNESAASSPVSYCPNALYSVI